MKTKIVIGLVALFLFTLLPMEGSVIWLKGGVFYPQAKSDLWDINFENLLLKKKDLRTEQLFFEYEYSVNPNFGVSFQVGAIGRKSVDTEYRDYEQGDGTAIAQTIAYEIVPIELNFRFYPVSKRHQVFPYIGGGVGLYRVKYEQYGEFIDFDQGETYDGDFQDEATHLGANAFVGLAVRPTKNFAFGIEGRYLYLKADLGTEFEGFDPLDLSGPSLSAFVGFFF